MSHARTSISPARAEYLVTENAWLARELAAARLVSANRLAAIRAALGAADDGESDPLAFLRDQLAEEAGNAGDPGSGR
jgi:hypothetical protein